MNEKTLKFNNIKINKKEFHKSKQAMDLDLIITDKIVVSDRFRHSEEGFKYFIGFQEDEIVKPLWIILPQMNAYIKYFGNGERICLYQSKMMKYGKNKKTFGMKLKIN